MSRPFPEPGKRGMSRTMPVTLFNTPPDTTTVWKEAAHALGYSVALASSTNECRALVAEAGGACVVTTSWPNVDAVLLDASDSTFRRVALILLAQDSEEASFWKRLAWDALTDFSEPESIRTALIEGIEQAAELRDDWDLVEDYLKREKSLSADETEVMLAVCQGQLNKQIARESGVSVRTIEQRRRHVFEKMGVGSVAPLAARLAKVREIERRNRRRDTKQHAPHSSPPSPRSRDSKIERHPFPSDSANLTPPTGVS